MAEEKIEQPDQALDLDTMSAYQFVLHSVKGISPVSTVPELAVLEVGNEEAA